MAILCAPSGEMNGLFSALGRERGKEPGSFLVVVVHGGGRIFLQSYGRETKTKKEVAVCAGGFAAGSPECTTTAGDKGVCGVTQSWGVEPAGEGDAEWQSRDPTTVVGINLQGKKRKGARVWRPLLTDATGQAGEGSLVRRAVRQWDGQGGSANVRGQQAGAARWASPPPSRPRPRSRGRRPRRRYRQAPRSTRWAPGCPSPAARPGRAAR